MTQLLTGLRATDKGALIAELAGRAAALLGRDAMDIGRRLAAREALGSTGTGGGIAVPHARLPGLAAPAGFFARLDRPIAFDAIDGRPVDLVFLLLSPEAADAAHLAHLAAASRRLRDAAVAAGIRAARSPSAIVEALGDLSPAG
jgi:PTS system nitrogen regulatory IIA component